MPKDDMRGSLRKTDSGEIIAARIRAVLAACELSLHRVSIASRQIYGEHSPSVIPHTLYHSLRNSGGFRPSLAQIFALSRITGYQIRDWLMVLGIGIEQIAETQIGLPTTRTRLIDPSLSRVHLREDSLEISQDEARPEGVFPLSQILETPNLGSSRGFDATSIDHRSFFAKVGSEDSYAFPELLPGSVVRIVPTGAIEDLAARKRPPLLLIEHERGLWCGRFRVSERGVIVAASPKLAYAPIAFQIPQEARILGAVDMEIRRLDCFESPVVPPEFAYWQQPRELTSTTVGFGNLLRKARVKAGLTLREASLLSQKIARYLRNEQYAIAQSTLSDCEVSESAPRHLEKIISLLLIYGLRVTDLVAASGNEFVQLGQRPIPAYLIPPRPKALKATANGQPHEEPLFDVSFPTPEPDIVRWLLRGSVGEVSGDFRPALRDLFWLSGKQPFLTAGTGGAVLALVDRRKKKPARIPARATWQQPAWVLLLRNGEYRCACCSRVEKTLILYPESDRGRAPEQLRLGRDVEVIGQIVGLARQVN